MYSKGRAICALFVALLLTNFMSIGAFAQRPYRVNDRQVQRIIRQLENDTDRYRASLDQALDQGRFDGTRTEDEINEYVRAFESSTDQLRDRFSNRNAVAADVEVVFERAYAIDNFMRRNRLNAQAQRDWSTVRADLQELARIYSIRYNTNGGVGGGIGTGNGGSIYNTADRRLTGTFRLDSSRSDDARRAVEDAMRQTGNEDRVRLSDNLYRRLEAPEQIALERRGNQITLATSRAERVTIIADGREETSENPNGRSSRVRANIIGDSLTVTSTGFRDNDITVVFEPLDNYRTLRVTRTVDNSRLRGPITVRSIYTRTSDVAQYNIYDGNNNTNNGGYNNTTNGDFIVPNGTTFVAVLNTDLSTKTARDNDRFTMTVRDSSQSRYDGAIIQGYVSGLDRGGRVTGRSALTLNFETITLRNSNRTYRFAGIVESVRTANGENVRVDNEGAVQEGNNRTTTTATRTAIGAGLGALIGAIAGGGKGAAIGAAIGAGTGAGSVYVQGRDDLELLNGTELTVRASSPR